MSSHGPRGLWTADYQSHNGAEAVYAYTVQAGDADDNGISIGANKLTGQRIKDAAGRFGYGIDDADLSHDAVADDAGHKVGSSSPPANNPPRFPGERTTRSVAEKSGTRSPVCAPVTATDQDGETLTYDLSGPDVSYFEIDRDDGQIMVGPGTGLDSSDRPVYEVMVTATDPENATDSIDVTITVMTGPVGPSIITGGGGGRSGPSPSIVDFEWTVNHDIEALDSGHDVPTGSWSDGVILWIAENGDGADDAYDLQTGERVEERDFELDERNRAPRGVWCDGKAVLWVSDSGQERLFAHDLTTGERLPERDIKLDERNADVGAVSEIPGGFGLAAELRRELARLLAARLHSTFTTVARPSGMMPRTLAEGWSPSGTAIVAFPVPMHCRN